MPRLALVIAWLTVCAARAAEPLPDPSPGTLAAGCRLTLVAATNMLGELAAKDEDGWFFPPYRSSKVVGTKEVEIRYSKKMVEYPVYAYENYYVYETPTSPGELPRRVQRQRIVRQTGVQQRETEYYDANGAFSRKEERNIYEKGGPDFWGRGRLGVNALAVCALRRAGVPADHPPVANVARRLAQLVETYGLPDHTEDLGWLAAAFSVMPGEPYPELTRRLVSKLADGQLVDGAGRGFWGPVCVNTRVLCAYVRRLEAASPLLARYEAEFKAAPSPAAERQRDQAKTQVEELLFGIRQSAMHGVRFQESEIRCYVDGRNGGEPVGVAGWAVFLFNQTTADLDGTLAALHGLAAAARAGLLPEETIRPGDAAPRKTGASTPARSPLTQKVSLPPPEKLSAVFARAANAVAKAQRPDGRWTECNVFEPIHDFDALKGFLPVPADPKSFPALPSPVTWTSSSAGLSALRCIGEGVGMDKVLGGFGENWRRGLDARRALLRELADTNWTWQVGAPERADAHEALLVLSLGPDASSAEDERLLARVARQVVCGLNYDANLGGETGWRHWVGSSLRRAPDALGLKPNVQPPLIRLERAHLQWTAYLPRSFYDSFEVGNLIAGHLSALLFLADRARPPAAGVWVAPGTLGGSVAVASGLGGIVRQFGVTLRAIPLRPAFDYGEIVALPMVCLRAARGGALGAPQAEALRAYLDSDGLVLVEAPASAEGETFVQEARTALGGAAETSWDVPAPPGEPPASPLKVRARLNALGRPNAVFLPIGSTGSTNGAVTVAQAGRVAAALLTTRLDRNALQPDYALSAGEGCTNLVKARAEIAKALQMPAPPPPAAPAVTNRPAAAGATNAAPRVAGADPFPEPPPVDTRPKPDEQW